MKKIKINGGAVLLIAVIYLFEAWHILALAAIPALVHELGHFITLKLCGIRVDSIKIDVTGVVMNTSNTMTYKQEMLTAAAGPAASAMLALVSAYAARRYNLELLYQFAGMNIVFCVFNLLPITPLDGGRILYAAAALFLCPLRAERIACAIGCAVLSGILCAGAYVFFITKTNFTLLLAAVWLFVYYCKNGNNSIVLR